MSLPTPLPAPFVTPLDAPTHGGVASLDAPGPSSLKRTAWWAGVVAALLLAGAGARVLSNTRQADALGRDSGAGAVRQVLTTRAKPAAGPRNVLLPATLRGSQEAAVHARAGGYLQRLTKDVGDSVRRGELLAVIDAPEAEQELGQALAARDQVRARAALTKSSLVRWESLGEREAVSRQEVDERRAANAQSVADLAAADANVKRLQAMESLRRVVAPFNGVVLRRSPDVGTLITAGNGRELYYLAEVDTLRIDLAVPQAYADDVRPGQTVEVRWPDRPGKPVEGRISRTAPGIDTVTRTRQVVIELPNPDRLLLPGSYVDVRLASSRPGARPAATGESALNSATKNASNTASANAPATPPVNAAPRVLTVPSSVLQFRQDGPRVALVQNDRIVLRDVKLGRDLGREVEVLSGLSANDRIVLSPPDSISEGDPVNATAAPEDKPKAAAQPSAQPVKAASGPA